MGALAGADTVDGVPTPALEARSVSRRANEAPEVLISYAVSTVCFGCHDPKSTLRDTAVVTNMFVRLFQAFHIPGSTSSRYSG
jgi:hypothetical protein